MVAELGCQAFALLFDDIDHSLSQADSETFSSFAHAQVSVANEIFHFLGEPSVFLFCPTEYCGSLCSPSVAKSPYLLTIGEELLPRISVIWTGSKVISRELREDSLSEVQSVLQRPPVVWDNLHANDYDSRRVFLGPFKGRPAGLRAQLRGLLLNPNCEFEANYIPLHSLGTWHRTGALLQKNGDVQYCPEGALSAALQDWMEELSLPLQPGRQVRSGELSSSGSVSKSVDNHPGNSSKLKPAPDSAHWEDPPSGAPPSIMAPPTEGGAEDTPTDRDPEGGHLKTTAPGTRPAEAGEREREEGGGEGERERRRDQGSARELARRGRAEGGRGGGPAQRTGTQSLLQDLTWLKNNSHCVSVNTNKSPTHKMDEWRVCAGRFQAACDDIARLHSSVVTSVNRAVLYDLYPYVWDLRNTALVAKAFVSWLDGRVLNDSHSLGSWRNCFHWCGGSSSADLLGAESEPWAFKGGLSGRCRPRDKVELYRMVRQLHLKIQVKQDSTPLHPDLTGDRYLGAPLALCPEYCLVLEDELGVCGGALGVLDVRSFAKRYRASWLPAMRDKYPTHTPSSAQEALQLFQEGQVDYPDSLLQHFPSQLRLDALPELLDCSVTRSLLTALLTALKANGSQGVFCEVLPTNHQRLELLTKLGFLELVRGEPRVREELLLGRLL
ncbi:hypothetical protein AAFF_G00261600 [Aldrovandia affinis]|uniref:Protein O-GlcNAcase-like n=1 Tax=Aldrovandia affinis TaxID=143900 RepID=A0AAD7RBP3_9TELE|nr:hypothetical protein AAFF_G00261600 [Aldrovandia affinis]